MMFYFDKQDTKVWYDFFTENLLVSFILGNLNRCSVEKSAETKQTLCWPLSDVLGVLMKPCFTLLWVRNMQNKKEKNMACVHVLC